MKSKKKLNKKTFSDIEIKSFKELEMILRKIHIRLINEGYKIKDGTITPPKNK